MHGQELALPLAYTAMYIEYSEYSEARCRDKNGTKVIDCHKFETNFRSINLKPFFIHICLEL